MVARTGSLKKAPAPDRKNARDKVLTASCPVVLPLPLQDPAAKQRSIENDQLTILREQQMEEKHRIAQQYVCQHQELQAKYAMRKTQTTAQSSERKDTLRHRHNQSLTATEDRHLSAEVDLHRTLAFERQACDTRLRHMEAYCHSPKSLYGMPTRVVTDKDYRELAQQYHVRDSMGRLHDSRINVLREKQTKQLERLTAQQEEELAKLDEELRSELEQADMDYQSTVAERALAFEERKRRLEKRWALAEAVARRRLEIDWGQSFAPLPVMVW